MVTGWGGLKAQVTSAQVLMLDFAPYDWLFPRAAAVVHHGGSGTTSAALRAGRPMVICPFVADQPFWGRRVAELGAGPPPIPQRELDAVRLAAAITTAVTDVDMRARARELAAKIQTEDGLGEAIAVIEREIGITG
jgi:sterol 3beta-glucosyltransferase